MRYHEKKIRNVFHELTCMYIYIYMCLYNTHVNNEHNTIHMLIINISNILKHNKI